MQGWENSVLRLYQAMGLISHSGEGVPGAMHGLCGLLISTPSISPASTVPLFSHGFQMEGKELIKLEHETQQFDKVGRRNQGSWSSRLRPSPPSQQIPLWQKLYRTTVERWFGVALSVSVVDGSVVTAGLLIWWPDRKAKLPKERPSSSECPWQLSPSSQRLHNLSNRTTSLLLGSTFFSLL